jgi:hypothetical protein
MVMQKKHVPVMPKEQVGTWKERSRFRKEQASQTPVIRQTQAVAHTLQ